MNPLYGRVRSPFLVVALSAALLVALFHLDLPLLHAIVSARIQYAPLGRSAWSEAIVGALYLIPTVGVTSATAFTLRKIWAKWIFLVFVGLMGVSAVLIALTVYWWVPFDLIMAVSGVLMGALVLSVWKLKHPSVGLPFQIWLGAGLAMLLLFVLPLITILVLCSVTAVWDLFSVFAGPLKMIVEDFKATPKGNTKMVSMLLLRAGPGGIGLGDIVFYCLTIGAGAVVGPGVGIAACVGVLAGVLLTLRILTTHKSIALPGLPLPLLFALVLMGLSRML